MDEAIAIFMPYLNELLEDNTFLSGNFITLSDINASIALKYLFEVHFEDTDRKKYRNVTRWFNTMVNQKEVKSVIGAVKLKEAKKEVVSSLDMETWKRFYMNNPHKESIEYLWKNIDIKVNGFFICDYKDYEELKGKKLFLTRNLANGIKQRAQDLCSKNSFGIILITGVEEGEHTIKILWLFESKQVPKIVVDELSDYDSFNWKSVNWKKDSDKKEIEAFLNLQDPKGTQVLESIVFR
jgi:elongation factor 1-gamma